MTSMVLITDLETDQWDLVRYRGGRAEAWASLFVQHCAPEAVREEIENFRRARPVARNVNSDSAA